MSSVLAPNPAVGSRSSWVAAIPVIHFVAILANGRRYAVGLDGPTWFLDAAQWAPRFGWWPWLALALAASLAMAAVLIRGGREHVAPRIPAPLPGGLTDVPR